MSALAARVSPRAFALIVLLIAACVLGLAPILVRLTETGPAAAGFWRFVFALPLLTLLASREPGGIAAPSKWALLAGLFFALDLSFWHYGIVMTSVANATVLCNLTPVVVTLFGWIVLKETPHRLFLLALALAMGGAFAMAAGADGGQGTNPPLGDLFSLSVAVWYSGYFLAVKAARARKKTFGGLFAHEDDALESSESSESSDGDDGSDGSDGSSENDDGFDGGESPRVSARKKNKNAARAKRRAARAERAGAAARDAEARMNDVDEAEDVCVSSPSRDIAGGSTGAVKGVVSRLFKTLGFGR